MKDHRYVDELTIEELEAVLRLRKRQERIKRVGDQPRAYDPLSQPANDADASGGPAPISPAVMDTGLRYSAVIETRRKARVRRPVKWRWIRDQFLLLIEILAVVGLLWVVAEMTSTVREINEDSRAVQTLPTITPTPLIAAFVPPGGYTPAMLPGGHTPPDANLQSQPAPIPAHLRSQVAEVTPLPVPTQGPEHAQRILIPNINVDAPVVEGDDWETLKRGAGHRVGSANPGERGNCVISAHNDIYGEIFRALADLTVGDEIVVQTPSTSYTYVVEQTRIVEPTDVSVLAVTSSPVLTLISCYPYRVDTHRIVVIASLVVN